MPEEMLTPEKILDAAVEVLRRYGPVKTTVVDVARSLAVSHGSVYRHFASKAALRDAVVERWLAEVTTPLAAIAEEQGPAPERLQHWLETLVTIKQRRAVTDPELFATYLVLAEEARTVVVAHVATLVAQLTRIVSDGVAQGVFVTDDPRTTARAIFDATNRFHKPSHAAEWSDPGIDDAFAAVCTLILRGLGTSTKEP
ncbi:MAG: TetR family transcriptional regulator [Caldilineaceae bacterium]